MTTCPNCQKSLALSFGSFPFHADGNGGACNMSFATPTKRDDSLTPRPDYRETDFDRVRGVDDDEWMRDGAGCAPMRD